MSGVGWNMSFEVYLITFSCDYALNYWTGICNIKYYTRVYGLSPDRWFFNSDFRVDWKNRLGKSHNYFRIYQWSVRISNLTFWSELIISSQKQSWERQVSWKIWSNSSEKPLLWFFRYKHNLSKHGHTYTVNLRYRYTAIENNSEFAKLE